MPNFTLSPNMSLTIPTVGQETGPQWASDINADLSLLDSHDHSSGKGVQVTPAGLNINADLTMSGNNLTTARSLRLSPQVSPISGGSDLAALYASGVDLYFNDANGNQIRITQSGGLAGTPGSIANLVAPASATYVSAQSVFVFQSGANQAANVDGGSFTLRNLTISSYGLTLSPPTLASNYTITLPALPASSAPMVIDNSGNISAPAKLYNAFVPSGTVISYAGASTPSGYLVCDGSAVSRSTYADLFAALGTAWGNGDGSTTFNVPDMRGMFLRGVTGASANDPDASSRTASNTGGNTGNNVGSKQVGENVAHNHGVTDPGHIHLLGTNPNIPGAPWPGIWNDGPNSLPGATTISTLAALGTGSVSGPVGTVSNTTGVSIQNDGGSESRPLNVYVIYCIKT